MPKSIALVLKFIAIVATPVTVIGFAISRREVSGDEYVAMLEILGTNANPGAIEIFGADIQTVSALLSFLQTWSLPLLLVVVALGLLGLVLSSDKLRATLQICIGLFFSFGLWAIFLTRSSNAVTNYVDSVISDLAALVISGYVAELSAELLNLTGLFALFFGALAIIIWLIENRRKARSS